MNGRYINCNEALNEIKNGTDGEGRYYTGISREGIKKIRTIDVVLVKSRTKHLWHSVSDGRS